jgi:large subunit ribosomal protein L22
MPFVAQHRFAKITARKARLLTDLIRNRPVGEALDLLKFNKKRGAVLVGKVLRSAIANADQAEADVEELYVSKSFCDDGPIMKRFMPKDRGKAYDIKKRLCHITVEVDEGKPKMSKKKRKELELRRDRLQKKAARAEKGGEKKGAGTKGETKGDNKGNAAPAAESK